jgi:hypothetical protein
MIRIKCPKCQKVLGLDDSTAGKPALCPACKARFMVPGPAKAPAAAGAGAKPGGPPAPKSGPAQDTWKKPGTEEDDFKPYVLQSEPPRKKVEDKQVDDMVKFAMRQKERDRAWKQVGLPAKILKVTAMSELGTCILAFIYISVVIILFLHKQRQGANTEPLFPFNDIPAARFPAYLVWGLTFGGFVLACVVYGVVLTGAESMKKLESWGWAMAGCIVAMIFLAPFGLFFGGLGLSVLLNKDVKAEFYKKPGVGGVEEEEEEEDDEDEEDEEDPDDDEDEEDEDEEDDD